MNWDHHKATWPNAQHSIFVQTQTHHWHIQKCGKGDVIVLLHGAGASTHSWDALFRALSARYCVVALDLPGHAFSRVVPGPNFGLEQMARALREVFTRLEIKPKAIIGHSAGAAIALRLALDDVSDRRLKIVSINGALGHFEGLAGVLFPVMAKLLSVVPFTASVFARTAASSAQVRRLIGSTGSQIDDANLQLYQKLFSDQQHVNGALQMMASWSLHALISDLPKVQNDVLFLTGGRDKAVPPNTSTEATARMRHARHLNIKDAGHLLHEEHPEAVLEAVFDFLTP